MVAEGARMAAAEARRAGAFDVAAEQLALVLDRTESAHDTVQRAELLLQRGQMLWAAEWAEESTVALSEVAALARCSGNAQLLVEVALSWRGGELRAIFRRADGQFLALVREALAASPKGDSNTRCLLLSRLAHYAY